MGHRRMAGTRSWCVTPTAAWSMLRGRHGVILASEQVHEWLHNPKGFRTVILMTKTAWWMRTTVALLAVLGLALCTTRRHARADAAVAVSVGNDDIGGVVTSSHGPEAGVWVIAQTSDLPTKYVKIVVTDDSGRYLIPELPKANYKVWVRGYGLTDSSPVQAAPGQELNLTAKIETDGRAAAQYYPAEYWYSLLKLPPKSAFPGTGQSGNGIAPGIKNQDQWID